MSDQDLLEGGWEELEMDAAGVRLHVIAAGPADGPLVILLHGFPEFWYEWRRQIEPLAAAGYRVLVPDQRGYHTSDKPPHVADYAIDRLVDDVVRLIDGAGRRQAALVGHDWGAGVAWWAAIREPARIARAIAINVPHPVVMRKAVLGSPAQMRKSWYMFALQLPWLPERMLAARGYRSLADGLQRSSHPGTFSLQELEVYRRAWSQPGALRGMVNWYRASFRCPPRRVPSVRVTIPLLVLWGPEDKFVGRELAAPSLAFCDDGRLEFLEGATHWVVHEEAQRVGELALEFLAAAAARW